MDRHASFCWIERNTDGSMGASVCMNIWAPAARATKTYVSIVRYVQPTSVFHENTTYSRT